MEINPGFYDSIPDKVRCVAFYKNIRMSINQKTDQKGQ